MFNFFRKKSLSTLFILLLQPILSLSAQDYYYPSDDCCPSENRLYIGGFGGGLYSDHSRLTQLGTAFISEIGGGPLAVYARGRSRQTSTGFGGVQLGYEWKQCPINLGCSDWNITPAAEFEALFYSHCKKGHLTNRISLDRLSEHDFFNSFPMNVGVYLFNGVISFNGCGLWDLTPYVGGGIGGAHISIHKARSLQTEPPEFGINHFNTRRHDHAWTFAAQAKAGLRYNICDSFHIFAEYRFLYLSSSRYLFGSTSYPGHSPTSPWDIDVGSTCYNAWVLGLQYDLY